MKYQLLIEKLFLQELDQLKPDPKQPSLEEINEIVKEVRQELWEK